MNGERVACSCGHGHDGICGYQATDAGQSFVFVFGSNLAGRHGAGSAKEAARKFGAVYGQGEGRQGQSYAIPTKDRQLRTLPLNLVAEAIDRFLVYAKDHGSEYFHVVKVGCGLAGFTEEQIRPLFAQSPSNVILPSGWESGGRR